MKKGNLHIQENNCFKVSGDFSKVHLCWGPILGRVQKIQENWDLSVKNFNIGLRN